MLRDAGLTVKDVEMIIMSAIGGEPVTTTVEGRNRFTVNVRYAQEFRVSVEAIREVMVILSADRGGTGAQSREPATRDPGKGLNEERQ